ncbi:MAG: hypothetical protein Q9159_005344 [Coniocarpon cinnabarinum]
MSKQYLTTHATTLPAPSSQTDVFSLAISPQTNILLIASGGSTLYIHSTASSSYPLIQILPKAHSLGCHHIAVSSSGTTAISTGFGGEVKIWRSEPPSEPLPDEALNSERPVWQAAGEVTAGIVTKGKKRNPGSCWAVAVSSSGRFLAGTTMDGKLRIWDLAPSSANMLSESENESREDSFTGDAALVHEFETRGGFGMGVDFSPDDALVASVHQSGSVHLFALSGERPRLLRALPSLHAPGRCVRFSPGGRLLAAAGDSGFVALYAINTAASSAGTTNGYGSGGDALYDRHVGDQVAILRGHNNWITSLDWSSTGEWIASCSWNGKVRVWSTERRECVSTLRGPEAPGEGTAGSEDGPCWALKWMPVRRGGSEGFVIGGRQGGLRFYREAAGG